LSARPSSWSALRRTVPTSRPGGHACPYRFRCPGCDHFRTDVFYLPDLTAYPDDLLRTRERLAAAADVHEWARADALPAAEEITRIRRLINRINTTLNDLTPQERAEIGQAAAAVRRHRAMMRRAWSTFQMSVQNVAFSIVREVPEERPLGDSGHFGDLIYGRRRRALLLEERECGVADLAGGLGSPTLRECGLSHGHSSLA
jgi:hypothetical protein